MQDVQVSDVHIYSNMWRLYRLHGFVLASR